MNEQWVSNHEQITEIETGKLRSFQEHPFTVVEDHAMRLLMESIRQNGILVPLIVMPATGGGYQIISGHRRKYCAEALGMDKVPAIIRIMEEEDSVIAMVDSNLQRPSISYSERAFAYKMKNEAMKRKNSIHRKSINGTLDYMNGTRKRTVEIIGEQMGESPRQISRYIRLTFLIPELLKKLDIGELSFNPAVFLSFLSEEEQRWVMEAMDFAQAIPSVSQSQRLRAMSEDGTISLERVKEVLSESKRRDSHQISFSRDQLYRFFPSEYSIEQIKCEIIGILQELYR